MSQIQDQTERRGARTATSNKTTIAVAKRTPLATVTPSSEKSLKPTKSLKDTKPSENPPRILSRKPGTVSVQTKAPLRAPKLPIKSVPLRNSNENKGTFGQRVASTSHVNNSIKDQIAGRLKKKSPWYDAIMNPLNGGGVKIPDPVGTNTGTYQHVEQFTVDFNANGVSGLRVISPYINSYVTTPPGYSADGSNFQILQDSSSKDNLDWGVSGDPGISGAAISFTNIPALMKANALSHRVVSACVIAQPEVGTTMDAGEMCAFTRPFRAYVATSPYSLYANTWDSSLIPIAARKPMIARWYPISSDYDPYNGTGYVQGKENTISYQDFIDPKNGASPDVGVIPWEFGIVCFGEANSGQIRYTIIVNYEFVPVKNAAMVTALPSPVDPMEESLVESWVASAPMTSVISQNQASKAPSDTTVKEEPTGLGMLGDVISEVVGVGKKLLPMIL